MKILPDEEESARLNKDSSRAASNNETRFHINPESHEVTITVVDGDSGEEIRQIPDVDHQQLSEAIGNYLDLIIDERA